MTAFDYIAGAILIVSGVIGLARGATREITTVIAFVEDPDGYKIEFIQKGSR